MLMMTLMLLMMMIDGGDNAADDADAGGDDAADEMLLLSSHTLIVAAASEPQLHEHVSNSQETWPTFAGRPMSDLLGAQVALNLCTNPCDVTQTWQSALLYRRAVGSIVDAG